MGRFDGQCSILTCCSNNLHLPTVLTNWNWPRDQTDQRLVKLETILDFRQRDSTDASAKSQGRLYVAAIYLAYVES
jgi:hypothetical protein